MNRTKKILLQLVWGVFALALTLPLYGATITQVGISTLNVRSGPSTGYRVLGSIAYGQQYLAIDQSGQWVKIYYAGGTAWCHGGYLTAVGSGKVLKINLGSLNVRSGPGTGYYIAGVSHSPEAYVVAGQSGDWKKIWFGGAVRWCYAAGGYATEYAVGQSTPTPTPTPTPASGATQVVFAVDISHWSGNINNSVATSWKNSGVKHVICGTQREAITRQQLQVAINNGFSVDAYVYLYFNQDMGAQVREALRRVQGFPITRIWLDIEDKTTLSLSQIKSKIWSAVNACGNTPSGIYTGAWWWKQYGKNMTDFSHLPLWYAWYDNNSSMSTWSVQKFGGWSQPWGKQYKGNIKLAGIAVDYNTIKVPARNP